MSGGGSFDDVGAEWQLYISPSGTLFNYPNYKSIHRHSKKAKFSTIVFASTMATILTACSLTFGGANWARNHTLQQMMTQGNGANGTNHAEFSQLVNALSQPAGADRARIAEAIACALWKCLAAGLPQVQQAAITDSRARVGEMRQEVDEGVVEGVLVRAESSRAPRTR